MVAKEAGYIEGRNIAIKYRSADCFDRLPALSAALVAHSVAVILTFGPPAAVAAKLQVEFKLGGRFSLFNSRSSSASMPLLTHVPRGAA